MRSTLHVISELGSGRLATIAHPRGDAWPPDRLVALAQEGVAVLVSALTAVEQERFGLAGTASLAAEAGLEFVSFPAAAPGTGAAESAARDEALRVVKLAGRLASHVRAGRFVATQCFGGIGRSTLLACSTLVLLGVAPGEALRRVSGDRDMPMTKDWLYEIARGALSGMNPRG
jgi:hypothetical protein